VSPHPARRLMHAGYHANESSGMGQAPQDGCTDDICCSGGTRVRQSAMSLSRRFRFAGRCSKTCRVAGSDADPRPVADCQVCCFAGFQAGRADEPDTTFELACVSTHSHAEQVWKQRPRRSATPRRSRTPLDRTARHTRYDRHWGLSLGNAKPPSTDGCRRSPRL